jgi:type I restriction enzyme M protein
MDRHRARQPVAEGRLPKVYAPGPASTSSASASSSTSSGVGLGTKPHHRAKDTSAASTSTSSRVRARRGQEGRAVLHAALVVRVLVEMLAPYKGRVYDPCCGSGGMFVQSRSSSTHGGARRRSASTARSPTHHLAPGQDEPRDPRHRGQPRRAARRHVPPRPAPRPARRLRAGQPAVQRSATGAASAWPTTCAGSTACRPRATRTSPGCSTSSTTSRRRHAGFVLANGSMSSQQSGEGEIRKRLRRGRPRRLHGGAARAALLRDADPGVPVVPGARQAGRRQGFRDRRGETCSSTRASWGA